MTDNLELEQQKKTGYRELIKAMGKKEFTMLKMQEYGFWPKDLPTPYERQRDETPEQYEERHALFKKYEKVLEQIDKLYEEKDEINARLRELRKEYDETWDIDKIRRDIAKKIMEESKARRAERKRQRELEKQQRSEEWQKKKSEEILFIGRGYSQLLQDRICDDAKLSSIGMPLLKTDKDLAALLGLEYIELRFLAYHRDVVTVDHYHRYAIPKRKGGFRNIAAPKPVLKAAQKRILEEILCRVHVSEQAHGFLKGKSVISSAQEHTGGPSLVINMDLKDFFPTITFERVRGMFKGFGYSGYIASLLAMLCTYCERMPIEVRGEIKYVKTSPRVLPQGSPASPMITNILCERLDKRLYGLANCFGFTYTRYADDMSFSLKGSADENAGKFCGLVSRIVSEEGFKVNEEKTRFLRKNNRQAVTGILVNGEEPGVSKRWVKRLRAAIYNANKVKAGGELPLETVREISGMSAWLKSVNEDRYRDIIDAAVEVIKGSTT